MVLNTLNTLIDDIILEARNSNVSESEPISRTQVEQWIIQYRAFLIKQSVDRGNQVDPSYVQTMYNVTLSDADYGHGYINDGRFVSMTSNSLPRLVNLGIINPVVQVTSPDGKNVQVSTETRSMYQGSRKYVGKDYVCYRRDGKLFVSGPNELEYINIACVAENPADLIANFTGNEEYPIPANILPTLKELIMTKELNILSVRDDKNDSRMVGQSESLSANDYKRISHGVK